jgi:hypothetical protein
VKQGARRSDFGNRHAVCPHCAPAFFGTSQGNKNKE